MKKGFNYSVVKSKCPRCNEGDLWIKNNSYSLGFDKMHEHCSECGLKYDMEQGFWYGAMYISYAMGVAVAVSIVVALIVLTELGIWYRVGGAALGIVLLLPPIFRYSRNIWLAIFVRYQGPPEVVLQKQKEELAKNNNKQKEDDKSNH